ncbi:protein of unknown function [Acidithiobacillus ferrivorans]|uniref:Uncharacterized protein n=1 Tax=Acidithiobacillus ferrivorans TaxID=160808 RepID=A0A060URH5_9PROT|nr:hypothetical protein AFERRI_240008 [Acidithiobacillus ferrivorans]SMH64843.1 protein of unknown function [Acidithiobacillus ferrivorans]
MDPNAYANRHFERCADGRLRQIFFRLPDARNRLGKQRPLPAILTVAAVLTQAQSYAAMVECNPDPTETCPRPIQP